MVLKKFKQADAFAFHDHFNFLNEVSHLLGSIEVRESGVVGGLGSSGRAVNYIDQHVAVFQKVGVLNFIVSVAVYKGDELGLVFA